MAYPLPYFRTSACGDKLKEKVAITVQAAAKLAQNQFVAMAGRDSFSETFPYTSTVLNDLLGSGLLQLVKLANAVLDGNGKAVLPAGSLGFKLGQGSFLVSHSGSLRFDGLNDTTSNIVLSTGVRDMAFLTPGMYHCPISLLSDWGLGYSCAATDTVYNSTNLYGCGGRATFNSRYDDDKATSWKLTLPGTTVGAQSASIFTAPIFGGIEINNDVADTNHAWFPLALEGTTLLTSAVDALHAFWTTYRGLFSIERREYSAARSAMNRLLSPAGVPWAPFPYGYETQNCSESGEVPDPGTPRSLPIVMPLAQIDMSASQVTRAIREPGKLEAIMEALRRRPVTGIGQAPR